MALAVFSNRQRARKELHCELHPNCLLTRWPLLFVTGPRSFFYFSAYWNGYTSYLAEHGYEVFNLRLPWNKTPYRQKRFLDFIEQQEKLGRKFHLFVDPPTFGELEELLRTRNSPAIMSLTEISDSIRSHHSGALKALPVPFANVELLTSAKAPLVTRFTYALHKISLTKYFLPSLSVLGACEDTALTNARLLLERSQVLAEQDFREG